MKNSQIKDTVFFTGVRTNANKFSKCIDFTSLMDAKEKLVAKYKLALTIQKIISHNQSGNVDGSVTSLRKLAASSETEYAIIQKITASKKDPQFSTLAAIIDGVGLSFSEFFQIFDSITKDDIEDYKSILKERSKPVQPLSVKSRKKTPPKKRK